MSNREDVQDSAKKVNRPRKYKKSKKKSITWQQRVVQIQRVSKVVKGGKKISFRTTVIIGNQKGQVGVGVGKADEVIPAIQKAVNDGKKNLITVPLTKTDTITHIATGLNGAAKVFIKPAGPGTGVIAGSSIRIVLELAGVQNILAKQLGSGNPLNNARATVAALASLKTAKQVAEERDLPIEKLFSYN